MDIDDASAMLAQQPRTVTHQEIRDQLDWHHADSPQRKTLAALAMDEIEAAIGRLAGLGHRFHLVPEAEPVAPAVFPMVLYRNSETRLVEGHDELAAAEAEGWQQAGAAGYEAVTDLDSSTGDPVGVEQGQVTDKPTPATAEALDKPAGESKKPQAGSPPAPPADAVGITVEKDPS